jgi:beta-galactosidase GanA
MKLRSNYPPYTEAVTKYFTQLFQILVPLQSAYGGPIIGFQVENEYAEWTNDTRAGRAHLTFLHKLMRDLGALEVMFTSDGQNTITDALLMKPSAHVIHTLNFQNANEHPLQVLKQREPHHPLMVMEFWTGWFDHWGEKHLERNISPEKFREEIHNILAEGASFNLYMFHGGTNFGFMNGGNWGKGEDAEGKTYRPTVSSYDYDAPLSEYGGVTQKYVELRNLLSEMVPDSMFRYPLPPLPSPVATADYGPVKMTLYISLMSTLQYVPDPHTSDVPIPMEFLPLNHGSGQGYGYVLYRTFIPSSASLLTIHGLKDYGLVMLDLKPIQEVAHFNKITLSLPPATEGLSSRQLDILVENGGRVNFGHPLGVRKGISGTVEVDGKLHMDWKIYSFEFKSEFVQNIDSGGMWLRTPAADDVGPTLFKGSFTITDVPKDTFIDMKGWNKGIVFVNGANLGRYWMKGPTGSLYVPAPLLVRGINKVRIKYNNGSSDKI